MADSGKREILSQEGSEKVETFLKPEFLEQAKKNLTKEEYEVTVERGTEPPNSGKYNRFLKNGEYYCKVCNELLFSSEDKFGTTCGWPAFSKAKKNKVAEKVDLSYGMRRVETICANCGAHLGHVFEDGPEDKGGLRYCINSVSIDFKAAENSTNK